MKSSVLPVFGLSSSPVSHPSFEKMVAKHQPLPLKAQTISTLQINVGKVCNQTCHHCHVDAGPHRTESMSKVTMDQILDVLDRTPQITTVDITGGAPEMNPHFEFLVEQCRTRNRTVIDRCNLTVFYVKGKTHLPQFLATHRVDIIASLPCYQATNVDQQRGKGVFDRSITALQNLNRLGYGMEGSGLTLHLVYNPLGPVLPAAQNELEQDFKEELKQQYGIEFNRLYTITNMPINRFRDELTRTGQLEHYYTLLLNSFNPSALDGLMCRSLVSVGWDGRLYDCDFNQMLDIPIELDNQAVIGQFNLSDLENRRIAVGSHCFGCTAGAGSSCGGALT